MSSGFVTETEAVEARKRRQEEWEKVRTAADPLERPEEPYDGRSLYDRLKEQKVKKDMEYEETHKLKNLIRGLDADEAQFLEMVDNNKLAQEHKQMQDDERELKEYRERVASLREEAAEKLLQTEMQNQKMKPTSTSGSTRNSQRALLGMCIKRKNGEVNAGADIPTKVKKSTEKESVSNGLRLEQEAPSCSNSSTTAIKNIKDTQETPTSNDSNIVSSSTDSNAKQKTYRTIITDELDRGALKCVGILPGIGSYTESSDSEMSSGSDDEPDTTSRFDLVGRKRQKVKDSCQQE